MRTRTAFGATISVCILCIAACEKPPAPSAPAATTAAAAPAETIDCPTQAIDDLYAMDTRKPVPPQPMMAWHQKQNMMDHLVAIQGITDGLARQDWEAIAANSAKIEPSPQMEQMCQHMGAGAEGFTELALSFHQTAKSIGEAARAKDANGVLTATSQTLQVCTSCHATFRQDVVSAQEWTKRTGSTHDPSAMHH